MTLNTLLGVLVFFNFFVLLPCFLLKKRSLSRELGLHGDWKLIYTGAQGEGKLLKTFTQEVMLCGKPDWVYRNRSHALIVEDKQGKKPKTLYLSQQMQLAAYFLLVEREFNLTPYRGVLRFQDGRVELSYEPALMQTLQATLREMRSVLLRKLPARRNHSSQARCRGCKFYEDCGERL